MVDAPIGVGRRGSPRRLRRGSLWDRAGRRRDSERAGLGLGERLNERLFGLIHSSSTPKESIFFEYPQHGAILRDSTTLYEEPRKAALQGNRYIQSLYGDSGGYVGRRRQQLGRRSRKEMTKNSSEGPDKLPPPRGSLCQAGSRREVMLPGVYLWEFEGVLCALPRCPIYTYSRFERPDGRGLEESSLEPTSCYTGISPRRLPKIRDEAYLNVCWRELVMFPATRGRNVGYSIRRLPSEASARP